MSKSSSILQSVQLPRPLLYQKLDHPLFPHAPDFSNLVLADDSPIMYAVDYVIQARDKMLTGNTRSGMIKSIQTWCGGNTVAFLRSQDDTAWRDLKMPLMARAYLKTLIMQAPSLNEREVLECEFCNGNPIDWDKLNPDILAVMNMGFSRTKAQIAVVVTNSGGVTAALNYLLLNESAQSSERERARRDRGFFVPAGKHHSLAKFYKDLLKDPWEQKTTPQIAEELKKIERQIQEVKRRRIDVEQQRRTARRSSAKMLLTEFMKGILCTRSVNAVEQQQIDSYMKRKRYDKELLLEVLKDLGFATEKDFDAIKNFDQITSIDEEECVVCFEMPRNQLIIPSMQVALCPNCAMEWRGERSDRDETYMNPSMKCPLTTKTIEDIVEVRLHW